MRDWCIKLPVAAWNCEIAINRITLTIEYCLFCIPSYFQTVLQSGVKRLVISGLTAIGCTPLVRQTLKLPLGHCSDLVNLFITYHNDQLWQGVAQLRVRHPQAVIVRSRSFGLVMKLFKGPSQHGTLAISQVHGVGHITACCCIRVALLSIGVEDATAGLRVRLLTWLRNFLPNRWLVNLTVHTFIVGIGRKIVHSHSHHT